jgi:hypothetical protein
MRIALLSLGILGLAACAPDPAKPDYEAIARSYLSVYVNEVMPPPSHSFYNGHPAAEIRVDYMLSKEGFSPTRHSTLVRAYENVVVTTTDHKLTVLRTQFTEPFHRGEGQPPAQ